MLRVFLHTFTKSRRLASLVLNGFAGALSSGAGKLHVSSDRERFVSSPLRQQRSTPIHQDIILSLPVTALLIPVEFPRSPPSSSSPFIDDLSTIRRRRRSISKLLRSVRPPQKTLDLWYGE